MKVELSEVIGALEFTNDDMSYVYDTKTGEILVYSDDCFDAFDDYDDEEELMDELENGDRYIYLPEQFDINEYGIMKDFIRTVENPNEQNELASAIRGRGAFRRFKNTVNELDLADDWCKYRDQALERIARGWCKENNIEIIED